MTGEQHSVPWPLLCGLGRGRGGHSIDTCKVAGSDCALCQDTSRAARGPFCYVCLELLLSFHPNEVEREWEIREREQLNIVCPQTPLPPHCHPLQPQNVKRSSSQQGVWWHVTMDMGQRVKGASVSIPAQ